jgi:tripartite-type tricarboxylate transporter receptor subunit TctC
MKLRNRQGRRGLLGAALLLGLAGPLLAQASYPSRAITLVVPFAPGGIADVTARAVAEAMAKDLGQPIVVDNRPSAGSIVATQAVAKAAPDGHTLLLMSNGNAVSVGLFKKLPYDTLKDLTPVSTLGFFDLAAFVPSNSRFATLQQAMQYAKANPGKLTVGTIAVGSTQHLAAKLFETVGDADFLTVPYKGSPAVLTALRSGEIDLALEIVGPMLPQVGAGVVKALAVTGEQRNPALPEVPTMQQAGIGGYRVSSWNAIAVPAGTPAAIVERLNRSIRAAVGAPATAAKLEKLGMRLQAGSPEQAQTLLASEIRRWGDVIVKAKIEAE